VHRGLGMGDGRGVPLPTQPRTEEKLPPPIDHNLRRVVYMEDEEVAMSTVEETEHKIIDMMEILKASLAAGKREAGVKRKAAKRVTKKVGTTGKTRAET
jgi:hypothetical protein